MDLRSILETARSFGFGGLVGLGIGAIVYYRYRYHFELLPSYAFIGAFGVLGLACQDAIERVVHFFFRPIFSYVKFRLKLIEIDNLVKRNRLTPESAQSLIVKMCEKRFLE